MILPVPLRCLHKSLFYSPALSILGPETFALALYPALPFRHHAFTLKQSESSLFLMSGHKPSITWPRASSHLPTAGWRDRMAG
ncbi:hypothetical protein JTE90_029696 [Oedothorax gibbosus]|uniref:Uncharacterized protein n=1 Tax=Oedothorax gibbosus TaxID=931172 RepID=A0AAV6ULH3_9ARAC|nr:hypothetical protein JTE90_029696 [Oedothorax gibbosus]